MMTFKRAAGVAVLGFVVVAALATVMRNAGGTPPAADASLAEVAAFYADNKTVLRIASGMAPLAWVFLAVFGAGAFARLRPVEREREEAWSVVGLVGIAMQNVLFAGVVTTDIALTAGDVADSGLWHLHNAYFVLNDITLGTIMAAFSIGGLRTGTLRRWHARWGLLAAALMLVEAMLTPVAATEAPVALTGLGLVAFLMWLVWLVTYGVTLLRESALGATADRPLPVGQPG